MKTVVARPYWGFALRTASASSSRPAAFVLELPQQYVALEPNPRFRELWAKRSVAQHQSGHKVVEHPEVGEIDLDSDTLTTQGSNLRVVVFYTPRPGTDARGELDLLGAIGTRQMAPRSR
ncbi:hypothetical protein [Lentzea xinjiangensis]|uniref:MmyB family transcriptional regulator n=1 Tax=Lentzea xinjiangensis TaxID=402600 RepID=UPI001FE2B3B8|nr:hypothetical protein [Lentzea xinjiangensis]